MKTVYEYLIEHGSKAVLAALTGITVATSAAGVVKVAGNMNFKQKVPEIKTVKEALKEDSNLSDLSPSPVVTQKVETEEKSDVSVDISPTTTPSVTINGGIHNNVKQNISVREDDQDDKKDDQENEEKKESSDNGRFEIDNDVDVSHQDSELNLNTEIKIELNKD